jgi:hypothetical protein
MLRVVFAVSESAFSTWWLLVMMACSFVDVYRRDGRQQTRKC